MQSMKQFGSAMISSCYRVLGTRALTQCRHPHVQVLGTRAITQSRQFSGDSSNNKLYEYRVYKVWPKDFKAFILLTNEWLHLRMAHSTLIGYWVSEIGGLNDVVHIWEYESLSQRAEVRAALAKDEGWNANYFSKMLPMLMRQENNLMKMVGNGSLSQPQSKGVYEIEEMKCQGEIINELPVVKGDAKLMANFQSIIGPSSTGYQLWFHNSLDGMVANQNEENITEKRKFGSGHSRLLTPTSFSPLQ